ncbi:thermonuclease family protein [Motiliproteus coralliicola]|uniref:thermonuclease family protein n=1 Tax=Motiliproteus coralliicola TaxID=2283196 RepID=UPI0014037546|nr:thermonuclease family protein [Motiliproteus coralliicola]
MTITTVIDGDTVILGDGKHLRLIGINTPELDHQQGRHQPLAQAARQQLQQLLEAPGLQLQLGSQSKDRHGRLLGHLYLADGRNVEAELLRQGLGFALSIAPNLDLRHCHRQAEQQARSERRGVWRLETYRPKLVTELNHTDGGFGLFRGRISRIGKLRRGHFIELDDKIFVAAQGQASGWIQDNFVQLQKNSWIEIRGWLSVRRLSKQQKTRGFLPFSLKLNHSDGLILCKNRC